MTTLSDHSRPNIADMVTLASRMAGIDPQAIYGQRRLRAISRARAAVCLIAREHGYSYTDIAKALRKDHTSVIHACNRLPILEMYEHGLARFVRKLRRDSNFVELALAEKPEHIQLGKSVPTAVENAIKPRNNFRVEAKDRDNGHRFHIGIGEGSVKLAKALLEARA